MLDFLNGKKAWLGAIVAVGPSLLADLAALVMQGGGDSTKLIEIGGKVLLIVGLVHKLVKGE